VPDPKPPKHLSRQSRAWWVEVAQNYDLEQHQYRTLTSAAEAFDRATQAREQVDADGLMVADRFGQQRLHPLLAVERDCRVGFLRALRELSLEVEGPEAAPARPPRIRAVS
jgi:phage terminase small subunit